MADIFVTYKAEILSYLTFHYYAYGILTSLPCALFAFFIFNFFFRWTSAERIQWIMGLPGRGFAVIVLVFVSMAVTLYYTHLNFLAISGELAQLTELATKSYTEVYNFMSAHRLHVDTRHQRLIERNSIRVDKREGRRAEASLRKHQHRIVNSWADFKELS